MARPKRMERWSLWRKQRGLKVAQVNALTRLARVMAFSDPDACVAVCERAVRVCATHDDPLLQARTEMLAGTWHIITNGWSKQQADRCAAARQKIGELLGPEKPAYYEILYAHVQALRGEYRDAYEIARSGLEKAAETHSLVVYLSSPVLAGAGADAPGLVGRVARGGGERHGTRREERQPAVARSCFAAMLGWLHMQAFDFAGARRIAEGLLETHAEEPAGQVRTMANLTIAYADLATGTAGECAATVSGSARPPAHSQVFPAMVLAHDCGVRTGGRVSGSWTIWTKPAPRPNSSWKTL